MELISRILLGQAVEGHTRADQAALEFTDKRFPLFCVKNPRVWYAWEEGTYLGLARNQVLVVFVYLFIH